MQPNKNKAQNILNVYLSNGSNNYLYSHSNIDICMNILLESAVININTRNYFRNFIIISTTCIPILNGNISYSFMCIEMTGVAKEDFTFQIHGNLFISQTRLL